MLTVIVLLAILFGEVRFGCLVIDVADPVTMTAAAAAAVVDELDGYLAQHCATGFLVRTVANTIFPQATYGRYGAPEFYDAYMDRVFPRLKRSPKDWGRYFGRWAGEGAFELSGAQPSSTRTRQRTAPAAAGSPRKHLKSSYLN